MDADTGQRVFEKLLSRDTGMLARKTTLLVTHSLSILPQCDYILVMHKGKILFQGGYEALRAAAVEAVNSATDIASGGSAHSQAEFGDSEGAAEDELLSDAAVLARYAPMEASRSSETKEEEPLRQRLPSDASTVESLAGGEEDFRLADQSDVLMTEEERGKGAVGMGNTWVYLKALGTIFHWLFFIVFMVAERLAYIGADW